MAHTAILSSCGILYSGPVKGDLVQASKGKCQSRLYLGTSRVIGHPPGLHPTSYGQPNLWSCGQLMVHHTTRLNPSIRDSPPYMAVTFN